MKVKSKSEVTQSCPTLSNPMDCSLPGSSAHGIFQQEYWSGVPLPSPEVMGMEGERQNGSIAERVMLQQAFKVEGPRLREVT